MNKTFYIKSFLPKRHFVKTIVMPIALRVGQPGKNQEPYFLLCYCNESHYSHGYTNTQMNNIHTYFCSARFITNATDNWVIYIEQ